MNDLTVIKRKTADLRSLIEKSLDCINPETSDIKAAQIMHVGRNVKAINIQVQNIVGQQVIFNLTMCLSHIAEIESQLNRPGDAIPETAGTLEEIKEAVIIKALEDNNWYQKSAAKQLGMSARALHYALNKYKINDPQGRWRLER